MAGACFAEEKDAKQFEQMMPVMAPKHKAKDTKEARKADAEAKKAIKEREEREKKEAKEREKQAKKEEKERRKAEKAARKAKGDGSDMVISAPTNFQHVTPSAGTARASSRESASRVEEPLQDGWY